MPATAQTAERLDRLSPVLPIALARARLAGLRARVTEPRLVVMALLLQARGPLSHQDVMQALSDAGADVDRVTVYRVLEWLVQSGLVHRLSGEDRVWRYEQSSAAGLEPAPHDSHLTGVHGHFQCDLCHRLYCLDVPPPAVQASLPPGFDVRDIDLTVRGVCAACRPNGDLS
jgi:Fur family ferric uptake transcriptional regulator